MSTLILTLGLQRLSHFTVDYKTSTGRPSPPMLIIFGRNLSVFDVEVFPPSQYADCVISYTVTMWNKTHAVVEITDIQQNEMFMIDRLDFCSAEYSFSAYAVTASINGEAIFPRLPGMIDYSGTVLALSYYH